MFVSVQTVIEKKQQHAPQVCKVGHTTDLIGQHFARFVRFSSLKLTLSLVVVEIQFGIMWKGTEVSVFVSLLKIL